MNAVRRSPALLWAGAITAVLGSACCLGPLLLVMLGFSGVWIGNLTVLEPYRLWFLGFTFVVLGAAATRVFGPVRQDSACEGCTLPRARRLQQSAFLAVALLALVGLVFPRLAHFFY